MTSWSPQNFNEACLRAAGRREYNRKRRIERANRITCILALQGQRKWKGRELAKLLKVHEATISRDLRFIEQIRKRFRQMTGKEMTANHFSWLRDAQGWQIKFKMTDREYATIKVR